jgi:hypothetical protein
MIRLMPIAYERDDKRRLITVTVTEPYEVADILGVIDRQAAEGTWMYATLYELDAPMAIPADSREIADHVAAVGRGLPRGPTGIAIAKPTPEQFRRATDYSGLSKGTATIEILLTPTQRDEWLIRNAPRLR